MNARKNARYAETDALLALEPLALLWTTFKSVKQRYGAVFMNRIVAYEIEIRYKRRKAHMTRMFDGSQVLVIILSLIGVILWSVPPTIS